MCRTLGRQCAANEVTGIVGMQRGLLLWFSTGSDGNGSWSETFFALVLALFVPLSDFSQPYKGSGLSIP